MPLPSPNSRTIPVFHSADGTEYPITNAGPLSATKSPKILAQLDKMLYTVEFDDNQFGTLGFKRLNTTALLAVEDSGDCNGHDEIDWSSPSVASRVKTLLTLSHDNIVGYRSLGCVVQEEFVRPRLAAILETSREASPMTLHEYTLSFTPDVKDILKIARQLLVALAYLHQLSPKIIVCLLRPCGIFINPERRRCELHNMEACISCTMHDPEVEPIVQIWDLFGSTVCQGVLPTPLPSRIMSFTQMVHPDAKLFFSEKCLGSSVAHPAWDIWAVGLIVVFLWMRRAREDVEIDTCIAQSQTSSGRPSLPMDMPQALKQLCQACFVLNPSQQLEAVDLIKMVENIITLLNEDDHLRRPDGPYLDSDNQGEIYFTVIKYINSGAFGSVVEITIMTHGKAPDIEANRVITNRGTNTKLALKILCHSQQMGETTADSLIKPNRLIKLDRLITLNHHNVVRYVATGLLPRGTDGRPTNNPLRGVLMEFYPGGDLNAKAKSGITGKVIAGYCVQILSGVAYLHAEGIAHGDLKGMNIFLSADGNTLKIGDLENMALLQETSTHSSGLDLKCGTLEHMSPEMLSYACIIKIKPSNVGRSTDLYSIGCVVLELFNGGDVPYGERLDDGSNVPYVVSDPERFAQKVCDKRVFPVVSRSRHDLRDLRSVIAYCLAFEKNKRKSASELLPEAQKIYENWD